MSERGTTLTAQALAKRDGDPAGVVQAARLAAEDYRDLRLVAEAFE